MQVHDEVCGMTITADTAPAKVEFQSQTYHFCSDRCAEKFKQHPDWYVVVNQEMDGDAAGAESEGGHAHH